MRKQARCIEALKLDDFLTPRSEVGDDIIAMLAPICRMPAIVANSREETGMLPDAERCVAWTLLEGDSK